jgi:Ca2+-binding RTX toxin-like protein
MLARVVAECNTAGLRSPALEKGGLTVIRLVVLLVSLALAVLFATGLALAAAKGGTNTSSDPTTIYCSEAGTTSCQGTSGPDIIYGTQSADVILPYGGDDTVYAEEGNDAVRHSFGNDTIWGGLGADTLRGGFGNDTIYGNEPATTLTGAQSDDVGDGARDLIDCAYLKQRDKGEAYDVGYGGDPVDVVVDCSNRDDQ